MRQTSFVAIVAVFVLVLAACERDRRDRDHLVKLDERASSEKSDSAVADETTDQSAERESSGDSGSTPTSLSELPEGTNAVQHEMRLLNDAMQSILTLIANDTLEPIPGRIRQIHPARKLTKKAIEAGEYAPPTNPDRMEKFKALDDEFHKDLKGLISAAKRDDLKAATDRYGELVQGCTNCHTKFRFPSTDGATNQAN